MVPHRNTFIITLLVAICFSLIAPVGAQPSQPPRTPDWGPIVGTSNGPAMAAAMDIPSNLIISASLGASDPAGTHVFNNLGGFPTQGNSFGVLSTGNAANASLPNSSGSLSNVLNGAKTSQGQDLVQLFLTLRVPQGAGYWAVDWKFLSEEYPEFVGSNFNDAFLIETGTSTFTLSGSTVSAPNNTAFDPFGNLVSINTTGAAGMSSANASGTTYDGATSVQTTVAPIPNGTSQITLIFSIFDVGDSAYDSAVFLDNFRFGQGTVPEWLATLNSSVQSVTQAVKPLASGLYTVIETGDRYLQVVDTAKLILTCKALSQSPPTMAVAIACAKVAAKKLVADFVVAQVIEINKRIADDPPDPNFVMPVELRTVIPYEPYDNSDLAHISADYLTALDELGSVQEAFLVAFERLQGAAQAGDLEYSLIQARATQQFLMLTNARLARFAQESERYANYLQTSTEFSTDGLVEAIQQFAEAGIPSTLRAILIDGGFEISNLDDLDASVLGVEVYENYLTDSVLVLRQKSQLITNHLLNSGPQAVNIMDSLVSTLEKATVNTAPFFDTPPTPQPGAEFLMQVGENLVVEFQASDTNAGDKVSLSVFSLPDGAVFNSVKGNPAVGTLLWQPGQGSEGTYVIPVLASDNNSATSLPRSVVVVVQPREQSAPVLDVQSSFLTQYSDSLTASISATDPDTPASALTFAATGLPSGLALTNNGDGTATIAGTVQAPAGEYTAQVTVTDPDGLSDTQPLIIVVGKENASLAYTGDTAVAKGAPLTLRAQVAEENDGSPGNITLATVLFDVTDSGGVTTTYGPISVSAAGVAAGSLPGGIPPGTYTVVARIAAENGYYQAPPHAPATLIVYDFAATPVLDTFNRAGTKLGSNWTGANGYQLEQQRVKVVTGGLAFWRKATFGQNQEAFLTLTKIDPKSAHHTLALKLQGSSWDKGVILVSYDAKRGQVHVETRRPGTSSWTRYAPIAAPFAAGDQLGARVANDGSVAVYRNGILVGTVNLSSADQSFFNTRGGRIGVWFQHAGAARFDDFGGGTVER